jgi:hypothetical protein
MDGGDMPSGAVGDFLVGEHPPQETLAVLLDRPCNSRYVRGIEAEADDI